MADRIGAFECAARCAMGLYGNVLASALVCGRNAIAIGPHGEMKTGGYPG